MDIRFLQKLDNIIFDASLQCHDESKIYAILNALFVPYSDMFWSSNYNVSVFTTLQNKLVGLKEMCAAPNRDLLCVIPDMTVKIARRSISGGEEKRDRQLVLLIEAKRLCIYPPRGTHALLS